MALSETISGFRSSRWFPLVWIVPAVLVVLFLLVLAARGIRASDGGQSFLTAFPGASALPSFAPVGFPAWLAWMLQVPISSIVTMVEVVPGVVQILVVVEV